MIHQFVAKWQPSAILDSSDIHWDHPRRVLGDLYRYAKFGWNRCHNLDNLKVFNMLHVIFCMFGLKMPVHDPKIGALGDLTA